MKNLNQTPNQISYLTILITIICLGLACKKDLTSRDSLSPSKTLSKKTNGESQEIKKYLNSRLDKTAKIIASLSRYEQFRKVVNEQVAKRFDGDYNVLLKDLIKAFPQQSSKINSIKPIISSSPNQTNQFDPDPSNPQPMSFYFEQLRLDLEEPYVVNGETVYPQIYIPFFGDEAIQTGDVSPCSSGPIQLYPYPVIVPFDGDESQNQVVFSGTSFDTSGNPIVLTVSECFASQNTVWAVTINESVDQSGTTNTQVIPSGSSAQIGADAYMPSMTIKVHKEVWIKGASEINMKYAFSWIDKISPTTGLTSINYFNETLSVPGAHNAYSTYITGWGGTRSGDDIEIRSFTRKQVNKSSQVNINFTYAPLSRPIYGRSSYYFYPIAGDYLYFVIYEYDRYNGTETANADGVPFSMYSGDSPYLATRIKIVPANQPTFVIQNTSAANISNSAIDFVSSHR